MARARKHKDVEYAVDDYQGHERIFKTFEEAAAYAIVKAMSNGEKVEIDVLVWSRAGAKWLEGDIGVETHDEDPEASVHKRIVIRAEDQGRVA
jgi:hypothetical protein